VVDDDKQLDEPELDEAVVAQQQQPEERCSSDPLGVDPPDKLPTEEDLSANADPFGLPVSRFVLPGHR